MSNSLPNPKKIILASQSPRRQQLLQQAEVAFEVLTVHTEELFPDTMPVAEVPAFLAMEKARAVQESLQEGAIIIAADTVVVLGNRIIGKPAGEEEAVQTLLALSGQTHTVITGVAMLNGEAEHSFSDTTRVHFHPLTEEQIRFYVSKYQPYDKAGAYAIQEWIGVVGIKGIEGCFYNVMGLPVSLVLQHLQPWLHQ
jgi:septum formation protein